MDLSAGWVTGLASLVLVALLLSEWALLRRDLSWREQFSKVVAHAATIVLMFLGVFLALWAGQCAEEQETRARLHRVIAVARSEAEHSRKVIAEIPVGLAWFVPASDPSLPILERPARALEALVSMPEFLERSDPVKASRLLELSTRLSWPPARIVSGNLSSRSVSPNPATVLDDLGTALELLRDECLLECPISGPHRQPSPQPSVPAPPAPKDPPAPGPGRAE